MLKFQRFHPHPLRCADPHYAFLHFSFFTSYFFMQFCIMSLFLNFLKLSVFTNWHQSDRITSKAKEIKQKEGDDYHAD